MRHYKINNIEHTVFDSIDELPENIVYHNDWRKGSIGDWVLTDDECVIQILRRGAMLKPKGRVRKVDYIGTCTGTFLVSKSTKLDSSKRVNIYSFGGSQDRDVLLQERENLSTREELFVQYLAGGIDPRLAYLKAFPTKDPNYAGIRAGQLIKTTRIRTAMKEELKPICEELGISDKSVLHAIKTIASSAVKDDTKLKALFKLADILDLEDKNSTQVTQLTGAVFQGFSEKEIEEVERKEITGDVRD